MMNADVIRHNNFILNEAKETIKAGKEFHPLLIHAYLDSRSKTVEFMVIPAGRMMADDMSKKMLVKMTHEIARGKSRTGYQLLCATLISDAFFSTQKIKPEHMAPDYDRNRIRYSRDGYIKPIDDPRRREGLMLISHTKDKFSLVYHAYERGSEGVTFTDVVDGSDQAAGTFSELYPKDL